MSAAQLPSHACLMKAGTRAWLWLVLFTLNTCSPARAPSAGPGDHVGDTCQQTTDCGEGLSCHYGGSTATPHNVCRLEAGRCRFDLDCGTHRKCRRQAVPIGVCEYAM